MDNMDNFEGIFIRHLSPIDAYEYGKYRAENTNLMNYKRVRNDVIAETLNEVTKRMSDYLEFDDLKIDWDLFCDEMKEIAEQLKEQSK